MLSKIWNSRILTWIRKAISAVFNFLWSKFWTKIVMTALSILLPTWFAAIFATKGADAVTPFGDAPGTNEIRRLQDSVSTLTVRTQEQLDNMADLFVAELKRHSEHEKNLGEKIEGLLKQGDRLLAFAEGSGRVDHQGSGSADSAGTFSDAWVDINMKRNPAPAYGEGPFSVKYNFTFSVADITATLQEINGAQYDLYSVFLRSNKDPNQVKEIGNYRKERKAVNVLAEPTELGLIESRSFRWNDLAINGDLILGGNEGIEAGFSVSVFSWGTGSPVEEAIFLRFPEVGLSTELKHSAHAFAGARLNAGHFLPLFSDLYLSLKYAYGLTPGAGSGLLAGIGTRL